MIDKLLCYKDNKITEKSFYKIIEEDSSYSTIEKLQYLFMFLCSMFAIISITTGNLRLTGVFYSTAATFMFVFMLKVKFVADCMRLLEELNIELINQ